MAIGAPRVRRSQSGAPSPSWLPSPLEEARSQWASYRRGLATLKLPEHRRRAVASAARKAIVFHALRFIAETRFRWVGGSVAALLATTALLCGLGRAAGGGWAFLFAPGALFDVTWLGAVAGTLASQFLSTRMILAWSWVYRRRPWWEPVTNAAGSTVLVITAVLCGWYAVEHVFGLLAGLAWGYLECLVIAGAWAVCHLVIARRWRHRGLPTAPESRAARLAAGALYSATLALLSGLAVNAASEHLPDPLNDAGPAWIGLAVFVILTGISAWRSAR